MIKIVNERLFLPIFRNPFSNWLETESRFIPLLHAFRESDFTTDKYEGWAFSIKFIKNTSVEYKDTIALMNTAKNIEKHGWMLAPSLENRNECVWIIEDIAVVIHQESWLWFG